MKPAPTDLVRDRSAWHRGPFGALAVLAAMVVLAGVLYRMLPRPPSDDTWPFVVSLVGLAGFFLVAGVLALGSAGRRLIWPQRAPVQAGVTQRVPRRGLVVAEGPPLLAPLSGQPCVAYLYRMYYRTKNSAGEARTVVVYSGSASTAFRLDADGGPVAVRAVLHITDTQQPNRDAAALQRARAFVAQTAFEAAGGLFDSLLAVRTQVSDLAQRTLTAGAVQRRDWHNPDASFGDLGDLRLEEAVLPVGATAVVVGVWSESERAIVPSMHISEPALAAVTDDGIAALRQQLGGVSIDGPGLRADGVGRDLIAAAISLGFGSGASWLARVL